DLLEAVGRQSVLTPADEPQRTPPRVGSHEDHFERTQGKDRVERVPLGYVAGRALGAVEAVREPTAEHRDEPNQPPEERRLSRTVRSEQCDELALLFFYPKLFEPPR